MKIGLSLPNTYISYNIIESDHVFRSNLGDSDTALSELSGVVDFIELSNFSTQTPGKHIVSAVRKIWSRGLKVSLHPSLPRKVEGMRLPEIYSWLEHLLPEIKNYQNSLMLNVHALAAPVGDIKELGKKTITNLKWITKVIDSGNHPIKLAIELNRFKGEVDPCTTYDGVLDICEQVDSPHLGIGWDFGHTFANYQNALIPRVPSKAFLKRITHSHIHDISPKGKTHWPLTIGIVPLEEYLGLLSDVGYSGLYTLELQPGKFSENGDVKELILESINMLKSAVNKTTTLII